MQKLDLNNSCSCNSVCNISAFLIAYFIIAAAFSFIFTLPIFPFANNHNLESDVIKLGVSVCLCSYIMFVLFPFFMFFELFKPFSKLSIILWICFCTTWTIGISLLMSKWDSITNNVYTDHIKMLGSYVVGIYIFFSVVLLCVSIYFLVKYVNKYFDDKTSNGEYRIL